MTGFGRTSLTGSILQALETFLWNKGKLLNGPQYWKLTSQSEYRTTFLNEFHNFPY